MRKLIILFFVFAVVTLSAQKQAVIADTEVSAVLKGLSLEKTIAQDSIAKLNGLLLEGDSAAKYKIVSYVFFVNYDKRMTNDAFKGSEFNDEMKAFFVTLEKNCHIAFKDIVVEHKTTGESYTIDPLNVTVQIDKNVVKKGQHSKH